MQNEDFDQMAPSEQIALVQNLWDQIAERAATVPVPPSHLAELARRAIEHDQSPDDVLSWDEVKANMGRSRG
ncbi:MAG: putative addiction module component (TIGR02574 family) [bacterium]|jgi:putative addiction module component (TIGR02574 family)